MENKKRLITPGPLPAIFESIFGMMEVFGLDLCTECTVMMERPSRTLEEKRISNNNPEYPSCLAS